MTSVSYKTFLEDVQAETKEDILRKYAKCELVEEASEEKDKIEELIGHLERKDSFAVWMCIANAKEGVLKEMKDLSVCQKINEYEEWKENKPIWPWFRYLCRGEIFKKFLQCPPFTKSATKHKRQPALASTPREQEQENVKDAGANEKNEQRWLTILSDPLYIGIKWLWNSNPNKPLGNEDTDLGSRDDVIESTLHDAYLFEELAKYEHHFSPDEYLIRSSRCENFAADVVEQGSLQDLHKIMDTEGNGPLVCEDKNSNTSCETRNYIASLHLLKIAAEKGRRKVRSKEIGQN